MILRAQLSDGHATRDHRQILRSELSTRAAGARPTHQMHAPSSSATVLRRAAVVGAVGLARRPRPSQLLQVQPPERLDDEHAAARQRPGPRGRPPVAAAAQGPRLRAGRRHEQHHRHRRHEHRQNEPRPPHGDGHG
ncbi:hypothetical protein PAHAL_4G275200 [Panicum hallii]|uniref:Uncharacterized protein n=1 Tax=Panicum hallii TaxID=206008 RepID=A0A2T8JE52_9POAL|nr:hypothetical protein PAHAL_4G275200 [Panicum hallii]